MLRLLCLACIAGLVVSCEPGATSTETPSTTASPATSTSVLLVFTTWAPDGKVSNGPEPGYKPAFTGLTSHDIQRAVAGLDVNGTFWIINASLTPHGAALFKQLTRDAVAACPSGGGGISPTSVLCAQRHLAIWLGLTQRDIDNWEDSAYADKASQPFDLDCLSLTTAATTCPKFVSDPVILQEIDGGTIVIGSNFTEQIAKKVAAVINRG